MNKNDNEVCNFVNKFKASVIDGGQKILDEKIVRGKNNRLMITNKESISWVL